MRKGWRAAAVTVSDGVAAGTRDDASGHATAGLLEAEGFDVVRREVVPDERPAIESLLVSLVDDGIALIATTGGTGFGPRDVTPEATRAVIDREAPGLAEEMRAAGRAKTRMAALSRGIAGSRGSTLIVNLPGSEKGATESLQALTPLLPHVLDLLSGETAHGSFDSTRVETARPAAQPSVMATAVKATGAPPCRIGQKMLLGPDGPITGTLGCAEFDSAALAAAREVLASGEPETRVFEHDLGSIEVYMEPSLRAPALVVFSATPVAAALVRWGRELGFDPVVVEARRERLTGFGLADVRVEQTLPEFPKDAEIFAVHTDHDAPGVAESLAELLRTDARFIGVMGSARHVGPHIQELHAVGFDQADLKRLRTPVGLDIGARTAEEIALSILAGVVAARRERDGGWLDASKRG